MDNNVKMIRADKETIELLSKIKGWHLLKNINLSYEKIAKDLIVRDAKKKDLIKQDN